VPTGRAHWRHLANTTELVLPSAHPSPQLTRQIDRFSRFCTAHDRKCLYLTMADPFPQNCPFSLGDRDPHLFHDSLRQTEPSIQTASRSVQLYFRTGDRRVSLYFTMGALSPKIALSHGESGPHVRHDSFDPSEPADQTASLSVRPFLHR